jgi:hypothetical protein
LLTQTFASPVDFNGLRFHHSKNALGTEKGAQVQEVRTRSRRGHASEYAVDLGGHDEVVLMQSIDLLGLQRDRRIAPTVADSRMMAFSFRESPIS